jgi:hypothetical protein
VSTRKWRRLQNEEIYDLYPSLNIWMIKSERMRWAGHVALLGKWRGSYRVLVWKPDGKDQLEDLGM